MSDAIKKLVGDALNDIINAIDSLEADKTELEETIAAAETIDTTDIDPTVADALEDAINDAKTVDDNPDATPAEVQAATDALNNAIDDILQNIIDEAQNLDTTGMSPESIQDLEDAIQNAEDILNDPDATPQQKADAINEISGAVDGLEVLTTILPEDSSSITVDRDTEYTYMVGLDVNANTVSDIKAQLKNSEQTIIITTADGTELSSDAKVGTGNLVKLVNAEDHSVVYEVATVILYGDINGDGNVNDTDAQILKGDAFFGQSNITAGTVYFYAADLDGDTALDGFDTFFQNGIITGGRYFDQSVKLYK